MHSSVFKKEVEREEKEKRGKEKKGMKKRKILIILFSLEMRIGSMEHYTPIIR